MSASSIALAPLRTRRPAPKTFMLGECRIRRLKASFLVLALLVAPALGVTTAEVSVMFLAPGDSKPPRVRRTSLRDFDNLLGSKAAPPSRIDSEGSPSDSEE